MKLHLSLSLILILFVACDPQSPQNGNKKDNQNLCRNSLNEDGKLYIEAGKTWLFGGSEKSQHFDVSKWTLNACNIKDYGLDRESFPALIGPTYQAFEEVSSKFNPTEKAIFLETADKVKVYPYSQMTFHEVINESLNGEPIMIAYCYLADLAAVYTRSYCGQELTFALTGYTYAEEETWNGLDGFLLWDRETESIWWPLIDRAVSGDMLHTSLRKFDESKWGTTTWGELQTSSQSKETVVLVNESNWNAPENWPRIPCSENDCCTE